MKIAVSQINLDVGLLESNLSKIIKNISVAAENGAKLVLFPEMSDTGYDMSVIKNSSSSKDDSTYTTILNRALESNITVAIGLSDKRVDGIYNTLTVFNSTKQKNIQYDKTHLFSAEPVCEEKHLQSGNHISTFNINKFTAGLMICYDIRFPEFSRSYAVDGINLLVVSAAWPKVRINHWETLLQARAIENQCFIIASNRVGIDAELEFGGVSLIISPTGKIISKGSYDSEEIIYGDINIKEVDKIRKNMLIFNDRRTDLYKL